MASLANQTISSTYDGLIKTSTDQPVPISGVQLLEDGVGNSLALSVGRANQGVTVTGTLTATSISGVLADGVTATTQTLGDNSTKVATTAYVDAQVTASDLDFAGDSGTGAVDLDSQTFTIAGTANEIETVASGQTVTIGLPSSVTVGTLNATTLGGTLSTAAQPNITSVGTLSSLSVSGDLTVDTSTLKVDSANNRVGIGTSSPSRTLDVENSAGASFVSIVSNPTNVSFLLFGDTDDDAEGRIQYDNSGDFMQLYTNGAERMRIDSSGNVGIGTSDPYTDFQVAGKGSFGSGGSSALGVEVMTVTAVPSGQIRGYIAAASSAAGGGNGDLLIASRTSATTSIRFFAGSTTESASITSAGLKFPNGKGINFSAVAGGGATSSLLDDYEEGTWTPAWTFSTSGSATLTISHATYTKIGRLVYISLRIFTSSVSSPLGNATITGLPFTSANRDSGAIGFVSRFDTDMPNLKAYVDGSSIIFSTGPTTDVAPPQLSGSDFKTAAGNNNTLAMAFTYSV